MRLNGIEILVGARSKKSPLCMHLNYLVSFQNDMGQECQRHRETLVHELALGDPKAIARIVAHVVCGLIKEDVEPSALPPRL